ncbi:MAG TPA: aryl-sulfate sulfotransferase, partial [Ilumatobacteraceae bacterium]
FSQLPNGDFISDIFPFAMAEYSPTGATVARWEFGTGSSGATTDTTIAGTTATTTVATTTATTAATTAGTAATPTTQGFVSTPDTIFLHADWIDLSIPHHDIQLMPNGDFLALARTTHPVTAAFRKAQCPDDNSDWDVTSDVAVEFDPSGKILHTWDDFDAIDYATHPSKELCVTTGLYASQKDRDWSHANAIVYDPKRNVVLMSVRHQDAIIAFDHEDTIGPQKDVRWIFGPNGTIPLTGDPAFHQHAPELEADGSIMLYDNGNFRPGTTVGGGTAAPYSRAVHYDIDDSSANPADWKATQVWDDRFTNPDGTPVYSDFLGDAKHLANGDVIVDNGGIMDAGGFYRVRVVEVSPAPTTGGDIVMDLNIGSKDDQYVAYRAYRLPSFYVGSQWVQPSS